jgi:hypothetical protein
MTTSLLDDTSIASEPQTQFPFFRLPLEIRQQIYALLPLHAYHDGAYHVYHHEHKWWHILCEPLMPDWRHLDRDMVRHPPRPQILHPQRSLAREHRVKVSGADRRRQFLQFQEAGRLRHRLSSYRGGCMACKARARMAWREDEGGLRPPVSTVLLAMVERRRQELDSVEARNRFGFLYSCKRAYAEAATFYMPARYVIAESPSTMGKFLCGKRGVPHVALAGIRELDIRLDGSRPYVKGREIEIWQHCCRMIIGLKRLERVKI